MSEYDNKLKIIICSTSNYTLPTHKKLFTVNKGGVHRASGFESFNFLQLFFSLLTTFLQRINPSTKHHFFRQVELNLHFELISQEKRTKKKCRNDEPGPIWIGKQTGPYNREPLHGKNFLPVGREITAVPDKCPACVIANTIWITPDAICAVAKEIIVR